MDVLQPSGAYRAIAAGTYVDAKFSADGTRLYGVAGSTVNVFDVASGTNLATYNLGRSLGGMDVSKDGRYLALADPNPIAVSSGGIDSNVYRIDLTSGAVTTYTRHVSTSFGSGFYDVSFLSDGSAILSDRFGTGQLTRLDFGTGQFGSSVPQALDLATFVSTPDRTRVVLNANTLYVAGQGLTTRLNQGDPYAGASPTSLGSTVAAISATGDLIASGASLNVFDGTFQVKASFASRFYYPQVAGMVFSPGADKLYVLDADSRKIYALSTADWSLLGGYSIGTTVTDANDTFNQFRNNYGDVLQISADGHYLSVIGTNALELVDLTKAVSDAATSGDDVVSGDKTVYGFEGNDTLISGAGFSFKLVGGVGDDSYYVRFSNDQIIETAGEGHDTVYSPVTFYLSNQGPNVEDLVLIGSGAIDGSGNALSNRITGNDAANSLIGGAGDDVLIGNGGHDLLSGGTGKDAMAGGAGDDDYFVDDIGDTLTEDIGSGLDKVFTTIDWKLGDNFEWLILQGSARIGFGNALANVIAGGTLDDSLFGLEGADSIEGNAGNDILYGGMGADTLTGGAGSDIFAGTSAELANDRITDFTLGERVRVTDVALTDLTYTRGGTSLSLGGATLDIGTANSGLVLAAAPGGGTDLVAVNRYTGLNDFDGDGHSDILFRNTDGTFSTWDVTGNVAANRLAPNVTVNGGVGPDWAVKETFDWNGDGRSDMLFRNGVTGQVTIWNGAAGGFQANAFVTGVATEWSIAGVGDLNGDGRDDIVWRNDNGALTTWQARGDGFDVDAAVVTGVATDWKIVGLADFNGDGKDDLLWRNAVTGNFTEWLSNGARADANGSANYANTPADVAFVRNAYANGDVGTDWHIDAMADFNGDGKDDLFWRHDGDGAFTIWQSTGAGFAVNAYVDASVSAVWQIQQAADYNDDGKADLLWRNVQTGEFSTWQSTGTGFTPNVAYVAGVGTDWHVQAHDYAFG